MMVRLRRVESDEDVLACESCSTEVDDLDVRVVRCDGCEEMGCTICVTETSNGHRYCEECSA